MNQQDADDARLGALVRSIVEQRRQVLIIDPRCDDACMVMVGTERQRSDGKTLDEAVDLAAHRIGVMAKAKSLKLDRSSSTEPCADFSQLRGKV